MSFLETKGSSLSMQEHKNLTPLMKQYWDIKSLHPDKILLFRMGDFFEMFYEDATTAAPILGIALTQRNKKSQDETPMCGMPHHAVAGPINKLLARGLKVVICDQIEDAKLAKGLVKRAVTRILTPGMVYDTETLSPNRPHYIVSVDDSSLSFVDTTTGEAFYFNSLDEVHVRSLFEVLPIAEIVLKDENESWLKKLQTWNVKAAISYHDQSSKDKGGPSSAQRLCSYLLSLSANETLRTLKMFEERFLKQKLNVSTLAMKHLEVFQNSFGEEEGSLFCGIDRTQTSAGARKLRNWLSFPLQDQSLIELRLDRITQLRRQPGDLQSLRKILMGLGDIERRLTRLTWSQVNARDLNSLAQALHQALRVIDWISHHQLGLAIELDLGAIEKTAQEIEATLVDEPPLTVKQGHIIRKGVSDVLDELIDLSTNSQALLEKMEAEEREKTGINSLKIRYNNVFGYYIEITHTHKEKVPERYKRKQTLANAERFYTDELIELERKVLSAHSRRSDLEYEIFENLRQKALGQAAQFLALAEICSEVDVLSSLAWISLERNYCRPQFNNNEVLNLRACRHPVVEQSVGTDFVPNDFNLQPGQAALITGPNMAGKSTVLRQVALISLMAQMGSYVPASSAELPLLDAIFTRIGASDHLSQGLSTFMVEMKETAMMLAEATTRSLVILDEIGRGTSTYDGLSLAQSLLEHLVCEKKSYTLFATHYHELTQLEGTGLAVKNCHMSVMEKSGDIRFLHLLKTGPATKSYGIHVARLAGIPKSVVERAQKILKELEAQKASTSPQLSLMSLDFVDELVPSDDVETQTAEKTVKWANELANIDLSNMTPIQVVNRIHEWQAQLKAGL